MLSNGGKRLNNKSYPFEMCCESFLAHLNRIGYSDETYRGYDKDLQYFRRFLLLDEEEKVDFYMEDITKEVILKFMDYGRQLGHKPNTIARRLSTLKSFYKYLVNELDYSVDVAARIRLPKVYIPLIDVLSESEMYQLLNCAKKKGAFYHLFFSAIYYTGSRLTPIRYLRWKDVNLEERVLYFPKVKGGKDLYLPLHEKLAYLLIQYSEGQRNPDENQYIFYSHKLPEQPISAADIRTKLKMIAKEAGIKKRVTPHSIRHCTATHLTIKKIEQRTIANILGHTDLRSTARYQHLSIEHLREPINVL